MDNRNSYYCQKYETRNVKGVHYAAQVEQAEHQSQAESVRKRQSFNIVMYSNSR